METLLRAFSAPQSQEQAACAGLRAAHLSLPPLLTHGLNLAGYSDVHCLHPVEQA